MDNDIAISDHNAQALLDNFRYPKRNRIHTLRFWLGERCIYRAGKIVKVIKIEN
jgi:hypothetical protein